MTVVLLHGFTGAPPSWDALVAQLPPGRRVLRPALSGHGPARAPSWTAEVDRLRGLLDAEDVTGAHLVGYSMGGRLGWSLLAADRGRFRAATLIGAHPGLSDPEDRRRRRAEDDRRAEQLERDGIDAFVDGWAALPMWASQQQLDAETRALQDRIRRAHDPAGLAHALRVLGLGRMPPVDPAALDVPVHLVVGALDDKHRALAEQLEQRATSRRGASGPGRDRAADARASTMLEPTVTTEVVEGCGHNVLLERPDVIARLIMEAPCVEAP